MEVAMHFNSTDETVRCITVKDLKDFYSESEATQAKKQKNLFL